MSTNDGFFGERQDPGAQAAMECCICRTHYDPSEGGAQGTGSCTSVSRLTDAWSCPVCEAPKQKLRRRSDPAPCAQDAANLRIAQLVADFRVHGPRSDADIRTQNAALQVEAVGFRRHGESLVGVLVTPWFMNLLLLPGGGEDWSPAAPGTVQHVRMPSGTYEFLQARRPVLGEYKLCTLFSPMDEFSSQGQAVAVAETVMRALFEDGVIEEACE